MTSIKTDSGVSLQCWYVFADAGEDGLEFGAVGLDEPVGLVRVLVNSDRSLFRRRECTGKFADVVIGRSFDFLFLAVASHAKGLKSGCGRYSLEKVSMNLFGQEVEIFRLQAVYLGRFIVVLQPGSFLIAGGDQYCG